MPASCIYSQSHHRVNTACVNGMLQYMLCRIRYKETDLNFFAYRLEDLWKRKQSS